MRFPVYHDRGRPLVIDVVRFRIQTKLYQPGPEYSTGGGFGDFGEYRILKKHFVFTCVLRPYDSENPEYYDPPIETTQRTVFECGETI